MSLYNKGAPKKVKYDDISKAPKSPGEYRIRDGLGTVKYVGETNNLSRRIKEHKKSGKFSPDDSVDILIANKSTSEERRVHERNSIKKYNPYMNKSIGGEGRRAVDMAPAEINPVIIKSKPRFSILGFLGSIGRIILRGAYVLVLLVVIYVLFKDKIKDIIDILLKYIPFDIKI